MYTETGQVDYRAVYSPEFRARADARRKEALKRAMAEELKREQEARQQAILEAAERAKLERLETLKRREAWARSVIDRAIGEEAEILNERPRVRFTYDMIEARACKLFNVRSKDIRNGRRDKELVFARQFVMYWVTRLTSLSLPLVGRIMGKDHTTILHGHRMYLEKRAKMGRTLRAAR